MEFQKKLLTISHKLFISGRKSYTPEEYHEIDEAIAAINELIKTSVPKSKRYIRGENPFAVENKSGWNLCRQKFLRAFGLTNKEEETDVCKP